MKSTIILPPPALSRIVKCFWTLTEDSPVCAESYFFRFLTDGHPELLIHYGQVPWQSFGGSAAQAYQDAQALVGVSSRNANVQLNGPTRALLVKLQPWALSMVLGDSAVQATDRQIDLAGLRHVQDMGLLDAVHASQNLDEAIAHMTRLLLKLSGDRTHDTQVGAAISLLLRSRGQVSMQVLEAHVNLGLRRLEQRFRDEVGVSPKQYARMVRARHVAEAITQSHDRESLTEIGYAAGYYDQAHFIREFKEFGGITPRQFAQRMAGKESIYQLAMEGVLPGK